MKTICDNCEPSASKLHGCRMIMDCKFKSTPKSTKVFYALEDEGKYFHQSSTVEKLIKKLDTSFVNYSGMLQKGETKSFDDFIGERNIVKVTVEYYK